MRTVLYINSTGVDYLADSFLIGLKRLDGYTVYEWPSNQFVYRQPVSNFSNIHGKGFTTANVLDPATLHPFRTGKVFPPIDIFIFSSIHRQFGIYLQLLPYLTRKNTVVLDGEDVGSVFPYLGAVWRRPYLWFIPRPHKRFLYFKRELVPAEMNRYFYLKLLPAALARHLPVRSSIREISFSIPSGKIVQQLPEKRKLFPAHIVDEEIARRTKGSGTQYAFDKEKDYYADLQASKFGITTKKAGWDCMRHYEIAANGAVICFKDLSQKPKRCAPHGLMDGVNCIAYHNYDDLMQKINRLTEAEYHSLQQKSIEWVRANTCERKAAEVLEVLSAQS